jgi:hypothetical protein
LLEKIAELEPLRQALVDARATLLWAASFPGEPEDFGFPAMAALGLREPMQRTLETRAQVPFAGLLAALQEDAAAVAGAFSAEQKRQLGVPTKRTPVDQAMWDDDPDNIAWKKTEMQRAHELAQFGNVERLGADVRDLRPKP